MAVIEIAKIQVRRGQENLTGMPQLDSGEFGWAVDTQKLYIGNGTVAEGAPLVGNTELITEHNVSNFFKTATSYVYQGNAGSVIATGPLGLGDTTRTLQDRLDDEVNVAAFGIVGDGAGLTAAGTPVYQQLQHAINQIFNNNITPRSRVTLKIPAGTYLITGTVYVPPYAVLEGDGPNRTVLVGPAGLSSIIMQTVGTSGTSYTTFPSIGSAGTNPSGISIKGIHFKYNTAINRNNVTPLLAIDCATNCEVDGCKFEGAYDHLNVINSSGSQTGIELRANYALMTEGFIVRNSQFEGTKYGIVGNYDNVLDTLIKDNTFNNHYRAISHGEVLAYGQLTGPERSKILSNVFTNVSYEGIYVGATSGKSTEHVSSFNSFSEVGNNRNGDTSAVSAIINFRSSGNSSIEDRFERDTTLLTANNDAWTYVQSVQGRVFRQSNVAYTATIQTTISSPAVLTRIPYAGNDQTIKLQYAINKQTVGIARKGDLTISISLGNTATVTDSYTYVGSNDGEMTFSAALTTANNTIKVLYTSTNNLGTIEFKHNTLK